jgi:hypothetical protein
MWNWLKWLKSDSTAWDGWFGVGADTGKAFFDAWTLAHLSFWLFIGSCIWPSVHKFPWLSKQRLIPFLACMVAAYGWEIFERVAEKKWPTAWLHPESAINSYLSDPLTTVVGVLGMLIWLDHFAK